jgi:hypothetical protein
MAAIGATAAADTTAVIAGVPRVPAGVVPTRTAPDSGRMAVAEAGKAAATAIVTVAMIATDARH